MKSMKDHLEDAFVLVIRALLALTLFGVPAVLCLGLLMLLITATRLLPQAAALAAGAYIANLFFGV